MKLYHGTNVNYLDLILERGIEPRGKRNGNWAVKSNPQAVYLTTAYGIHFAVASCKDKPADLVILEVESERLNATYLAPDEDALEQGTRNDPMFDFVPGTEPFNMKVRTEWFRERALKDFAHLWLTSLDFMGTCCYHGTVHPRAITGYVKWPYNHSITYASDPSITPLNFKFMGPYYKNLTRAMFGYDLDETESLLPNQLEILKDATLFKDVERCFTQ